MIFFHPQGKFRGGVLLFPDLVYFFSRSNLEIGTFYCLSREGLSNPQVITCFEMGSHVNMMENYLVS